MPIWHLQRLISFRIRVAVAVLAVVITPYQRVISLRKHTDAILLPDILRWSPVLEIRAEKELDSDMDGPLQTTPSSSLSSILESPTSFTTSPGSKMIPARLPCEDTLPGSSAQSCKSPPRLGLLLRLLAVSLAISLGPPGVRVGLLLECWASPEGMPGVLSLWWSFCWCCLLYMYIP